MVRVAVPGIVIQRRRVRALVEAIERGLWLASVQADTVAARGSREERRLLVLHRRLGVPAHYVRRGLPLHTEARETVGVACGLGGAVHHMTPQTREQWVRMKVAAEQAGVPLAVCWAFRSLEDQAR